MKKEIYLLTFLAENETARESILAELQQVFGSKVNVINTNQEREDLIETVQSCFSSHTVFVTNTGPEIVALVSALIAETNEIEQDIVTLYSELYFFYEFEDHSKIEKIYPYS